MKRIIPIVAVFVGVVLFCMGRLGQGVYHGIPYLETRSGTFAGADDRTWRQAGLSDSERMMLWGMIVAGCGAVGVVAGTVVRVVRRQNRRGA
jgi:hypothetical protein